MSKSVASDMKSIGLSIARSVAPTVTRSILRSVYGTPQDQKSRGGPSRLTARSLAEAGLGAPTSGSVSSRGGRRRRRRRRRRTGGGGGGGGPPGGGFATLSGRMSSRMEPVAFSDAIVNTEEMFQCRPIRSREHGPGACCAFTSFLADVQNDGVALHSDYRIPFLISTLQSASIPAQSGFINSLGNRCSGLLLTPMLFGLRMNRELVNWQRYRVRWIRISYVNNTSTSQIGTLCLAFSRDPVLWSEATGTQGAPAMSFTNLTQTIPNAIHNVYKNFSIHFVNRENVLKWCEQFASTPGVAYGDLAYLRDVSFGRVSGLLTNTSTGSGITFGQLWIDGEIEFYNPSVANLSIAYTQSNTNSVLLSSTCYSSSSTKYVQASSLSTSTSSSDDHPKDDHKEKDQVLGKDNGRKLSWADLAENPDEIR